MSASKTDQAVALLAEHFKSDEANYRNRELGEQLDELLNPKPAKAKAAAKPDDDTGKTE